MGGGDLNMKKSWHPVLLVNQERVWKAEKSANEEKKKLAQLRKEQDEERQLAELQRLQEQATGRKRVDKLDWMYAAPSMDGGALGGARIGEKEMEDYLLGKRRVDEVLSAGDKNIGNTHKEFIAVQNANTARDTAAKIREDPLLAIKRQEQASIAAMANRPEIRRRLNALQKEKSESKEERHARKKAERKVEKKLAKQEDKERRHRHGRDYRDSRSPRSDYSDDRMIKRERRDSSAREEKRYRDRSLSPRRAPHARRRDDSPRRYRDDSARSSNDNVDGRHNGHPNRHSYDREDHRSRSTTSHDERDVKPYVSRPSALDMAERPTSSASRPETRLNGVQNSNGNGDNLDEMRAARLAAMTASASDMYDERSKVMAQRLEQERQQDEREQKMRARYGKEEASAGFFKQNASMGLSESLSRRAGKGLQRDI